MRQRAGSRLGSRVVRGFVSPAEREQALAWLGTLHPLWEHRFSTVRPLPAGETQRLLQRPVYWLGNWQFACLHYYTPPKGTVDRCVRAEPFPELLRLWVRRIERLARDSFPPAFVPEGWTLNTCLVNFYGDRIEGGRREDRARVGAHRDHEPGPVASVSLGERAMFQFTTRTGSVVDQTWLEDRTLQVFAGPTWKDRLFHRVQRVARDRGEVLPPPIDAFETRRVNLTFRYVPEVAIVRYADLGEVARADVREMVETLAEHSEWWRAELHGGPA
jgi:DNA oxidative demethylase